MMKSDFTIKTLRNMTRRAVRTSSIRSPLRIGNIVYIFLGDCKCEELR